jgi:hypothetical protein
MFPLFLKSLLRPSLCPAVFQPLPEMIYTVIAGQRTEPEPYTRTDHPE